MDNGTAAGIGISAALCLYVCIWGVFGGVGWWIGSMKGRPGAGLLLGLLAGFIGWFVVLLLPAAEESLD